MIQRYSRSVMRDIWTEQRKLEIWLEIELLASDALVQAGIVPAKDCRIMKARAGFDLNRCKELEKTLNHDVIAFTTCVPSRSTTRPAAGSISVSPAATSLTPHSQFRWSSRPTS